MPAPRKKYNTVFDVLADKNIRIALAEQENSTKNIYQIYLGDFDNSVSWIGRGRHSKHKVPKLEKKIMLKVRVATMTHDHDTSHASRYIIVCSGPLFGQPCENCRCESTVNFKKLTGLGSISAKTVPAPTVANQRRNTTKPGQVKLRQVPHYELTENFW